MSISYNKINIIEVHNASWTEKKKIKKNWIIESCFAFQAKNSSKNGLKRSVRLRLRQNSLKRRKRRNTVFRGRALKIRNIVVSFPNNRSVVPCSRLLLEMQLLLKDGNFIFSKTKKNIYMICNGKTNANNVHISVFVKK